MNGDVHECSLVLIRPYVSASRLVVTRMVPTMSSFVALGSLDSTTAHRQTATAMMPIGTLTQNTDAQPKLSTSTPPTTGPIAMPRPEMPAQTPIASGICSRGKALTRIDSESGFISAAPVPWRQRAMISCVSESATAQSAEKIVNSTTPTMNMRLRPNRSPSLPPSRISAANVTT